METAACEASELPFADDEFDLVFGHAVLHHLPDLDAGLPRVPRACCGPGGVLAFCGEPSRYGDRLAAVPKRGALALAPLWRALMGAEPRGNGNGAVLSSAARKTCSNSEVDVHAFTPAALSAHAASAGFTDVRVRGEELAASLFGWVNRTLEACAEPDGIPWAWRVYAHRGYLRFSASIARCWSRGCRPRCSTTC